MKDILDERMEQELDLFEYGDEDTREIAWGEILRSGPGAGMPLEEYIPILLWDLTKNDPLNKR
jgi:hypothetical protein